MSFFGRVLQRFQHQCETSEHHIDPSLETHYYRTSFDKAYEAVGQLFSKDVYEAVSHSKEHGEWGFMKKGSQPYFIIASVVTVRPFETAVDFKLTYEKTKVTGPYPSMKNEIISYYRELDKMLPYLGKK
ncbi:hypothetical protein [Falsibacillus pallidus]|uniref:hypothetical protein n=1 Tax=Falsibacillus pallidus TaxID=493781 RepID=UPI003D9630B2